MKHYSPDLLHLPPLLYAIEDNGVVICDPDQDSQLPTVLQTSEGRGTGPLKKVRFRDHSTSRSVPEPNQTWGVGTHTSHTSTPCGSQGKSSTIITLFSCCCKLRVLLVSMLAWHNH